MRVYTSRLLEKDPSLVLHGGGNTSVKSRNLIFGETGHYLYVKGSGWDLATIERAGFAAVKMDVLLKMAKLSKLSDSDMVKYQKAAMTDPVCQHHQSKPFSTRSFPMFLSITRMPMPLWQ